MTAIELAIARAAAANEIARIDSQIAEIAVASRASNIAQVRALMADHGLTSADLGASTAKAKPTKVLRPATHRSETGQEWGGRGKRPGWLSAALAGGRTLDSYRIAQ